MNVLVTGGAGFVGLGVVRATARRGWRVRVLDPTPAHPLWPAGVEHAVGSLLDPAVLATAMRGIDLVFHVAGLWGAAEKMWTLNVDGTTAILATGAPVVYTSSSITCGLVGDEDGPSEDPRRPIRGTGADYRKSKLEAERRVRDSGGWIVNPDYVVGAGDRGGVVMGPLLRAARLPVIPIPGGGKSFVGVDDVGEGHVLAFERGQRGRRYLLGAENRSYRDVIGTIARFMGRHPRIVPLPDVVPRWMSRLNLPFGGPLEQMVLERYRSSTRARTELGWAPGPVDAALRDAVHGW